VVENGSDVVNTGIVEQSLNPTTTDTARISHQEETKRVEPESAASSVPEASAFVPKISHELAVTETKPHVPPVNVVAEVSVASSVVEFEQSRVQFDTPELVKPVADSVQSSVDSGNAHLDTGNSRIADEH